MFLNLCKSAMCDISGEQLDPKAAPGATQTELKLR